MNRLISNYEKMIQKCEASTFLSIEEKQKRILYYQKAISNIQKYGNAL